MFDFLDPKLMPKVSTNVACMDGYEAENLISDNFLTKSRGFLSFTSIKPPVEVDFQLICPVNIHYVVISTVIGTQKTTGIEILAKNPKSETISLAQAIFDQPGVVFCNSRVFSKSNPPPNCSNFYLAFFKSHTFRQFTNASQVKVRIIRTERCTVPCLGKIEIWGKVSKSCSQVTMSSVEKIMGKPKSCMNIEDKEVRNENEEFVVPEDFKDAITYEIMSVPMTLPSGHSVDQSTLEKCINNDNAYGRQATDPFTGLKFTESRKPVLNVSLKTRIDMFLVENAHRKEVANVQRTVGGYSGKSCDRFKNCTSLKRSFNAISDYKVKINESKSVENKVTFSESKRIKLNPKSYDESLMETINKVMNSVNFVRFTEDAQDKPKILCCEKCKTEQNLYELPCLHLYCRLCLIELCKILRCKVCNTAFSKRDPKKFHV